MNMPTDPTVPTSLVTALVIAVTALAGVVGFLFRYYSKRDDEHTKERLSWAVERAQFETMETKIRAEYDDKHRDLLKNHSDALRTLYDAARVHENTARREYAANMEIVAAEAAKANDKIGAVLEKFYDRYVGPRRPRSLKG